MTRCNTGCWAVLLLTISLTVSAAADPSSGWQGAWNLGDLARRGNGFPPGPLKADVAAALGRALRNEAPRADPNRWCRPSEYNGNIGGLVDNIEFLFTPQRLTIVTELGLIRRVFLDGRRIPLDVEATHTGWSVGRWEGPVLVIETTKLSADIRYHPLVGDVVTLGEGASITERLQLIDSDHLQVDTVLVAPAILTAPDQRRQVFTRAPADYTPRAFWGCWGEDRSIDPVTGRQRFDLTPPADLPPPPRP